MRSSVRFSVPLAMMTLVPTTISIALWVVVAPPPSTAVGANSSSAERGYRLLMDKPYLPADFDQETFDQVWQVWPEPLRSRAEAATRDERRRLAFARYGLTQRPGDSSTKPLQYVVDERGRWTMNCFACHGGKVRGRSIPGLPNSLFDLATLTEEIRATKVRLKKPLTRMDVGSMFMPLGTTVGRTNAVMFGVVLMAYRDADLNVYPHRPAPKMVHHDMDPPPWWHFRRREWLYIDGFVAKGHRDLMPFLMVRENGPEKFREWERDFQDIYAYLESLEPPTYPLLIDEKLAETGRHVFVDNCARCHGIYGPREKYPGKTVPIEQLGTDPVRLHALSREHRHAYGMSWFTHYGEKKYIADPAGYVAPPLDGIWASAPYLHNGSVPTLWHLLRPSQRPAVWKRSEDGYDAARVGLEIETYDALPAGARASKTRRRYFDTRRTGDSAAGHTFPDRLDEDEKRAVLEYLKSL